MGAPIAPRPMNPIFMPRLSCFGTLPRLPCRGMADPLLFVTQVAPYHDGPAGVHGVFDQAAVGVHQIAEMHGLRGAAGRRRTRDHGRRDRGGARAGVVHHR